MRTCSNVHECVNLQGTMGFRRFILDRNVIVLLVLLQVVGSTSLSVPLVGGVTPFLSRATTNEQHALAQQAMEFLDQSPDPFHAVQSSIDVLEQAGFQPLHDFNPAKGSLKAGGKYYFTKNRSTLVAFAVGGKYSPGNGGFKIIGGHTDSPNLRIKPRSKRSSSKSKTLQLGAECYGGGLWHTWFDRDLGVSGRVFCRTADGRMEERLVKIHRPILRIPTLAIHLQTAEERNSFSINKEDHLSPILADAVSLALNGTDDGWREHQEPLLLHLLAKEMGVDPSQIVDFELHMFDTQKASLGGARSEFLFSSRLDNLASCFLAVRSIASCSCDADFLSNDPDVNMIVLYDHEEVGSCSAYGAAGPVLQDAVRFICESLGGSASCQSTVDKSFLVSSDQAHALHPNYEGKHERNHQPQLNAGIVLKRNTNQRYATNTVSSVLIREVARLALLPHFQEFMVKQDCGCGSTIGPLISAATGIRTVDLGCPQLSMHSIREQMGVVDCTCSALLEFLCCSPFLSSPHLTHSRKYRLGSSCSKRSSDIFGRQTILSIAHTQQDGIVPCNWINPLLLVRARSSFLLGDGASRGKRYIIKSDGWTACSRGLLGVAASSLGIAICIV
eukprot:Nitzschia sp. Nitz4//scaffold30_size153850//18028//20059//NITZ4_002760-RA/size153850-augustus-gene-0.49-mRNA-1//1//CDS//3329547208//8968//frame0